MKVSVDPALCEGNAVCEALAPILFVVDDDGQAQLLADDVEVGQVGEIDESQRGLVERAAESCPRLAIAITD